MSDAVPWDDLDPGIRRVVRLLVENGFETCDSGDGRSKFNEDGTLRPEWQHDAGHTCCVNDVPHVVVTCDPEKLAAECDRMHALLRQVGVKIDPQSMDPNEPSIQGSYDPAHDDRMGVIALMGVDDRLLDHVGSG